MDGLVISSSVEGFPEEYFGFQIPIFGAEQ